tara:strand:- start:1306 stop:2010 length:705 start_codon:yes stop_codon:yes gene_type:complete
MALPSSGAISFANLQTEFGGSHPITMGEYSAYRQSGSGNTIDMADFYDAFLFNTTSNITSGYIYAIVPGPRGGTRYRFSTGFNAPSFSSFGSTYSAPSGSASPSSNMGTSSGLIGTGSGTLSQVSHSIDSLLGANSVILASSGPDSNSGFTTMQITGHQTTQSFNRTGATYSYSGGKATWTWMITAGNSTYINGQIYGSSPAHSSKLFGLQSPTYGYSTSGSTVSSSEASITFS